MRIDEIIYKTLIAGDSYRTLLKGLGVTFQISLLSLLLGTLLGVAVCAMRRSRLRLVRSIAAVYMAVVRGSPVLLLLMLMYYVVFAGSNVSPVMVAVAAFSLHMSAYTAACFYSAINATDAMQVEAARTLGFSRWQAFTLITLPQTAKIAKETYQSTIVTLIQWTSVVGYVTITDLTRVINNIGSRTMQPLFMILVGLLLYLGMAYLIFMQCGPIRYLVDAKSQADKRTFSHFIIPRFTRARAPAGSGIQELYAAIVKNENRNASLVEDAVRLVREGRSPILLTERKEHAAQLATRLQGKIQNVFLLVGSDKPKEKREKLAALQAIPASEEVVVAATGKYIGEGFDAPRLDTLLLAMPISWRGTLAQYAGRLHRNYEGKHEVRIYDYVDVHIPMLERMYHKRLKGYAELGYQVRFGTSDEPVSMIYDGHNAMAAFEQDLSDAAQSIVIVSPYLQKGRVGRLLPLLQSTVSRGVKITVHTNDDDTRRSEIAAAVDVLQSAGAEVILHKDLQQRYAVSDERIVWYGNVDLLAFGRRDMDVLRFENADIGGELLSLTDETECEQLMIAD